MNKNFAENIRSGKICFGTWLSLDSPIIAELCTECGFDWVLLDLEHGYTTEASVLPLLQATRQSGTAAIVRVPSLQKALIGRLLDWGASGIMLPHVTNADQAAACVSAMRFFPGGTRGYSSSSRMFQFGLEKPHSTPSEKFPVFLAQIECSKGIENANEIGSVDGVDALFVGPSDLKLALSSKVNPDAGEFENALDSVSTAARNAGVAAGILVRNEGEISKMIHRGYTCIAIGSDLAIVRSGYQAIQQAIERIDVVPPVQEN